MLIDITDDFDLEKIINCGQCFRAAKLENGYFQFVHKDSVLKKKKKTPGVYEADVDIQTWKSVWHPYFDLNRNYSMIRLAISSTDVFMQKAAFEGSGIRILRQDPWEILITFIISQRKSIPAIKQSIKLISEKWGKPVSTPNGIIYTFPTAKQLIDATENEFKDCKVGYRASYISHAVHAVAGGKLDLDALYSCDYSDIIDALMKIKGVGIKVANCVALFSYGQVSAVPIDTWIKKIITDKYFGIDPFPYYGEVAGIMQQYAFCYAQNHKEEFSND